MKAIKISDIKKALNNFIKNDFWGKEKVKIIENIDHINSKDNFIIGWVHINKDRKANTEAAKAMLAIFFDMLLLIIWILINDSARIPEKIAKTLFKFTIKLLSIRPNLIAPIKAVRPIKNIPALA